MATFEFQDSSGATYEIDAPDQQQAITAFQQFSSQQAPQQPTISTELTPQDRQVLSEQRNIAADDITRQFVTGQPVGTTVDPQSGNFMTAGGEAVPSTRAPAGMVVDPATGQYMDPELIKGQVRSQLGPDPAIDAVTVGAGQGASLGFGDEALAGLLTATGEDSYERNLMRSRALQDIAKEDAPVGRFVGDITGSIATGLGAFSKLPTASTLGGQIATGTGIGATEGGLRGFGEGEGVENRAGRAATGGVLGGAFGAGSVPVTKAITSLAGGARNLMGRVLNAGSAGERAAHRALAADMRAVGKSEDDIVDAIMQAQRQGQDVFTVADALGVKGQRRLSGLSRGTGEGSEEIAEYLAERQAGQGERLSGFVEDAFGVRGTAAQREATLTRARSEAADVSYRAARENAGPVNLNQAIGSIDDLLRRDPILGESELSGGALGRKLRSLRGRMATDGEQLIDFDQVLGVKQEVQDAIGTAVRQGRNNQARELQPILRELDQALEASSPAYRQANDEFAQASRVIDQLAAGKEAARPAVRAGDVADEFGALTPGQQSTFRQGFADPLLTNIERARPGASTSAPLSSPGMQAKIGAVAQDPATLQAQIGREQTMGQTAQRALGGSRTAENLADVAEIGGGRLAQTLRQGPLALVGEAAASGVNALRGMSGEAFEGALSKLLISRGSNAQQAARRAAEIGRMDATSRDRALRLLSAFGGATGGMAAQPVLEEITR